ncbi:MAG: 4Fe-4S dicluster domain-containing protein [Candidatus Lokiarchaeota archaeon]|nr:4Fe-4S dicluster domain-containing protein [Candidatus Lokiarchaeota archaeon]
MTEFNVYEGLRLVINKWPIRTPKSKNLTKLLQLIFTPEEAEIMSFFEQPMVDQVPEGKFIKRVKSKTDKYTDEQIINILDGLARRCFVTRQSKVTDTGKLKVKYSIWPMVIGIFEWFFSKAAMEDDTYSEETIKKVSKLFEKYFYEGFIWEVGPSNYPWARILPAHQANKIVEINQKLNIDKPIVLPFEQVKNAVEKAKKIAIIKCACRTEGKYKDNVCDKPIDICMVLDDSSGFEYADMVVKNPTTEEALELLKQAEKKGLVHCTSNSQQMNFICNCCYCHCGILRGFTEMGNPRAFMKSNYLAEFNENECQECFRCIEICPTKAIKHIMKHEKDNARWEIEFDKCIGCGLCASNCPTKRIDLKKVRNEIPVETVAESYMRMERERVL